MSSTVDANTLVDKHNPTPVLVRVCEEGLYEFAKLLLEKDATVSGNSGGGRGGCGQLKYC